MEQRTLLSVGSEFHHIIFDPTTGSPVQLSEIDNGISPLGSSTPGIALTPTKIRTAYGITSITGNGAGQTIAIVDAYRNPNIANDLIQFDNYFGLPAPPSFQILNQNGVADVSGVPTNAQWAGEIALDVEWAHAIAPGASIILVEANSNNDSDLFTAAVTTARNLPGVSVVSMSFGRSEWVGDTGMNNLFTTPAGHTGVTFLASTGDSGSPGQFPAYSPNVVAVGGTTLTLNGNNYSSETGWGGSGGGTSLYESKPSYQNSVNSTSHRQIPDVAFDASPDSGVAVYDSFNGGSSYPWYQFGGTSLSAPCWAGLIAIANQLRNSQGLNPLDGPSQTLPNLYALPATDFHDITSGSNGGYQAGPGYDEVTGRGSPVANLLVPALVGVNHAPVLTTPQVTPTSGDIDTTFEYTVHYYDQDGDSPAKNDVYIDGTPHTMSLKSGTLSNGTYSYETKLPAGNHFYMFWFSDGSLDDVKGNYSGPVVSAASVSFTIGPWTISDPTTKSDYNNNNNQVESGEKVDLNLSITNIGPSTATNIKVTLVYKYDGLEIRTLYRYYNDLPHGQSDTHPFEIVVHKNFSGMPDIDVQVTCDQITGTWVSPTPIHLPIGTAPYIYLSENDYAFGTVTPGTPVAHTFTVSNLGTGTLHVSSIPLTPAGGTANPNLFSLDGATLIYSGGSQQITLTIPTTGIANGTPVSWDVRVVSDTRNANDPREHITIHGTVSDQVPFYQFPTSVAGTSSDISGNWITWSENGDIYAYNLVTFENRQITNDSFAQSVPVISGDVIAWVDRRNGTYQRDIYGYSFTTKQVFPISTDSWNDIIVGVDNGKVAFARAYYQFSENTVFASHLVYNLWSYDVTTGVSSNITGYTSNSNHLPMNSVDTGIGDCGGGRIAWYEFTTSWVSNTWNMNNYRIKTMPIGGSITTITLTPNNSDSGDNLATDGNRVVWSHTDASGYHQVYYWNGTVITPLTSGSYDSGDDALAIGGHFVVYDKYNTSVPYYHDLNISTSEYLITNQSTTIPAASARMDGSGLVWESTYKYYAFLQWPDIAITDMSYSNPNPHEGDTETVTVTLKNQTLYNSSDNITVRLYNGDPSTGGSQVGPDAVVVGGLLAGGTASKPISFAVPTNDGGAYQQTRQYYAVFSIPDFANPKFDPPDNKTTRPLIITDNRTLGPAISGISVSEFNGDNDSASMIATDEQIKVSWTLNDPTGIASTQLLVDGISLGSVQGLPSGNPTTANCYVILSPLTKGDHTFVVTAVNADKSPDSSSSPYTGNPVHVYMSEEITVLNGGVTLVNGQATPIDFGSVPRGNNTASKTFVVRNDGEEALTLGTLSIPAHYSLTSPPDKNVLFAGDSTTFTVTLLSDTIGGPFAGAVQLVNSDGDNSDGVENPFTFPITGTVTPMPPEITVVDQATNTVVISGQSTPIDFGAVQQGSAAVTKTFTVRNDGDQSLTLITPFSNTTHYTVSQPAKTTLVAGETTTFTITLITSSAWDGVTSDLVSFGNNDGDNGDGVENPFHFGIKGIVIPVINGTAGNDIIRLVRNVADPNLMDVYVNNSTSTPTMSVSRLFANSVPIYGLAGNDQLIVDFSRGVPLPMGGINYDGGSHTSGDSVMILDTTGNDSVTLTSTQILYSVAAGSPAAISYTNTEFFSFNLLIGHNTLTIDHTTLNVNQDNAFSTATDVIVNGGILNFNGHANPIGTLTLTNGGLANVTAINNTTTTVTSGTLNAISIVCDTLTIGSAPGTATSSNILPDVEATMLVDSTKETLDVSKNSLPSRVDIALAQAQASPPAIKSEATIQSNDSASVSVSIVPTPDLLSAYPLETTAASSLFEVTSAEVTPAIATQELEQVSKSEIYRIDTTISQIQHQASVSLWTTFRAPSLWGIEDPRTSLASEKLSNPEPTVSPTRIEKPQYTGFNSNSKVHYAAMKSILHGIQEGDLSDSLDFDLLYRHVSGNSEELPAKAVDELLGMERL